MRPNLTNFFEGYSWFKFNNMRLELGMALRFCTIVAKELKLKVKRLCGLILAYVEVAGEKVVGGAFLHPHPEWR